MGAEAVKRLHRALVPCRYHLDRVLVATLAIVLLAAAAWHLGTAGYLHAKAGMAQWLIARAWIHPEGPARPWPWADMHPVARLSTPRLQHTLYVLSDASDRSLAFGPGVWQGEVRQLAGTLVLAGHRDTHFAVLRHLVAGDAVELSTPQGLARRYRVAETRVVDARRQTLRIAPEAGALIMITCYPFDAVNPGGPLRYVVVAVPETQLSASAVAL